jgi:GAF domain-containing protein
MPFALDPPQDDPRYAALMNHRLTRSVIGDARSVELVEEAGRRFAVPMASIGIVGKTKLHFVAEIGTKLHVIPRADSFTEHALAGDGPLVVEDTALDERFAGHPTVVGRRVRFFAVAPLIDRDGHRLGGFSLLDRQPHRMTAEDVALLVRFAGRAMARIALLSVVSDVSRRAVLPEAAVKVGYEAMVW